MTVSEKDLHPLTFLAEGGFATVHRTDFLLPGDTAPLVYKKFVTEQEEQARSARLVISFRDGLSSADRAELDEYAAWPRVLVDDGRANVRGLLMPLIPAEFFCRQADPDTGKLVSKPRNVYWLIASAAQRGAARVDLGDVERTERLVVLAKLVYIIGRLHRHGLVFGDLSFRNAVFALDPPRLKLLDCDGAAHLDDPDRKQASTPFWAPPECPISPPRDQELLDQVTDVYKLGLAILRCLTPGKGAATTTNAGRLAGEFDARGMALVVGALSSDRSKRPTAREIYGYLLHLVKSRTAVPEVTLARLPTPLLLRGQDARIEWRIAGAAHVVITWGNGQQLTVDLAKHPHGFGLHAAESGPVSIEARNRFGAVTVDLGELVIYELPRFNLSLDLPRLAVPAMEVFRPPAMSAAMSGRPQVLVGGELADLPSLDTSAFITGIQGLRPPQAGAAWPRIDETVSESAGVIKNMVLDETKRAASALRTKVAMVWP